MSEEIKYEPVFGDQSLFDNAPLGTELVGHSGGFYKNSPDGPIYCGGCTFTTDEYRNIGFIAARRIIRTPTWTVADWKAGKLPEVGCKVFVKSTSEVGCIVALNNNIACILFDDGAFVTVYVKSDIKPIESQEEKAARLEDEWISAATSLDESPVLTDNAWRRIYRLQLSGDLPVPVKGE